MKRFSLLLVLLPCVGVAFAAPTVVPDVGTLLLDGARLAAKKILLYLSFGLIAGISIVVAYLSTDAGFLFFRRFFK